MTSQKAKDVVWLFRTPCYEGHQPIPANDHSSAINELQRNPDGFISSRSKSASLAR